MPVEIKLEAEKSFIGAWLIDDLDLCDRLIDYFESVPGKRPGVINSQAGSNIIPSIKSSTDLNLDPQVPIVLEYANHLQQICDEYIKVYEKAGHTSPWVIEAANIQKYNPGEAYFSWHTERASGEGNPGRRHLVFMTYLNDVNDEGETEFFYQKIKVKPRKGLTLIWPADWTHTHRGVTSPSEVKYIVTGWYIFVPFNPDKLNNYIKENYDIENQK